MRAYYTENNYEWSRSTGAAYTAKVKMTRKEYEQLCKKNGSAEFGYLGDAYRTIFDGPKKREIRFTHWDTGIRLCYLLGIEYHRNNYCIEIIG